MTTKTIEETKSTGISSAYLFNEHPLVVRPELARVIGLNEAIVIQQVRYWCNKNEAAGHNKRDGYTWTYGSVKFWQREAFSWWSVHTVRRIFDSLEGSGLLVSGRFNRLAQDRTKWYRIDYDLLDGKIASAEIARPCVQNGHMVVSKMDTSTAQNGPSVTRDYLQRLPPETTPGSEEGEDNHHHSAADIVTFFQENMNIDRITPVIEEELRDLVNDFSPERVTTAIAAAALHPPDSPLPYIRKVLENERDGEEKEKGSAEEKEKKPTFKHAPHCFFNYEEVLDLVERFGRDGAAARINFLSRHKGSTGQTYASDYETILKWDARGDWDPEPQGWTINEEWLNSISPKPDSGPGIYQRPARRSYSLVVCGYIPGNGSRSFGMVPREIASIILGLPSKNDTFSYHGKCGAGFGVQEMTDLYATLQELRAAESVFTEDDELDVIKRGKSLHQLPPVWTHPKVVVEITSEGFTKAGKLTAPMLKRVRPELKPQELSNVDSQRD